MEYAIEFNEVVAEELVRGVSFTVPCGCLGAVVASRQEENDLQVRLMLGLTRPTSGTVTVLGEDVGGACEKQLIPLRKRIAVVFPTGGLVSNLKVWENLVLPLEYHSALTPQEIEDRGMGALARVGYGGGLMELPGHLSLYQKRQIGLARAMLVAPALVVYHALLDGLSTSERSAMIAAVLRFQNESPGRTSLFMTTNQESIKEIPLDGSTIIKGSSST